MTFARTPSLAPSLDPSRRSRWLLLACLGLITLGPVAVHAQSARGGAGSASSSRGPSREDLSAAKRRYSKGAAFYESGNYQAAGEEFQEAYRLSHLPDLLFNLARVSERLGRQQEAIGFLEKYLQERPDAQDRADIEKKISQLKEDAKQAPGPGQEDPVKGPVSPKPKGSPGSQVSPDPQATPPEPRQEPVPGRQGSQTPPSSRSKLPPVPALALLGGGAGLLIVGIGLGGAAISTAHSVESPTDGRFQPDLDSKGKTLSSAAIAFDVLGAAALVAGATWTGVWYVRGKGARGQEGSPVRASLSPAGLGLLLSGSY